MDLLPCGHVANEGSGRLCVHLVGVEEVGSHYRVLRGRQLECDFVCSECERQLSDGGGPELVAVCEGCVERVASETWEILGWRGEPGIDERPEPLQARHLDVPGGPGGPGGASPAAAVAPFDRGWITIAPDGGVWVHAEDRSRRLAATVDDGVKEPPSDSRNQPALAAHASPDGRFVAVVNDYGQTGVVLDLSNGTTTLRLDRGSYHPEQTPFPAAFATTREGGTVLVAATDWNRVDAFDPATGRLLTPREPTRYRHGEERPAHYLDYFHGALHASPDGRRILDDGWVWAPVGIPRAWSVERWLDGNVWEAEDGPSVTWLAQRSYLWDVPMCWIDDTLVAVWGLGADDEAMLDGATVYDVDDGLPVTVTELAGVPRGHLWSDGRRLYATGAGGLSVWDPYTGERTAQLPDLAPIAFNRRLGQFLVQGPAGLHPFRLEPPAS